MIECITDVESEMYELLCRIPDDITNDDIRLALESAVCECGGCQDDR